jgi:threonine synthase
MYTCPHTAVALAVLEKLVNDGTIPHDDKVVAISTASGLKFTEFKVGYHEGSIAGISSSQANKPVDLPADFGAVVDAMNKFLG